MNTIEEIGKNHNVYAFLTAHRDTIEDANRYNYPMIQRVSRSEMGDDAYLKFAMGVIANYGIDIDDSVYFGDCWYDLRDKDTFGELIPGKRTLLFVGKEDIALFQDEIDEVILKPINELFNRYVKALTPRKNNTYGKLKGFHNILDEIVRNEILSEFYREFLRLSRSAMDSHKAKYPDFARIVNDHYNKFVDMVEEKCGAEGCILRRDAVLEGIIDMSK